MDYSRKTKQELISEINRLTATPSPVKGSSDRKQTESASRDQRILDAYKLITRIESRQLTDYKEYIDELLKVFPIVWPPVEKKAVSIRTGPFMFVSPGYRKTGIYVSEEINGSGASKGIIELTYLGNKEESKSKTFTQEEKDFLASLAIIIGHNYDRYEKDMQLHQHEDHFKTLLESLNEVIYDIDKQGIILYISPSVSKVLGYTNKELIGRNFLDFMGDNQIILAERFKELMEKKVISNDYMVYTKSGEPCWIRLSTRGRYMNEEFVGGTGTLTDITNQKLISLELQKSEALYSSILSASPDAISISDLNGKILFASPVNYRMFGYDLNYSFIGHSILEYLKLESGGQIEESISRILAGNNIGALELKGLRKNGSTFDIEVNTEIIRDQNGVPVNVLLITRDISDRKTIEEKLQKSEDSFKMMVERINDVVFEISLDGTIRYISPAVEINLGYRPEEVINQNMFDFIFPEDMPVISDALKNLGKKDFTYLEYRYICKDGSVKWFRSSTSPMISGGNITGGIGILTNIHNQKQAEIKLLQSEEKYRSLINSTDASIVMVDFEGYCHYLNPIAAAPFKRSANELIGLHTGDFFPPDEVKVIMSDVRKVLEENRGFVKEVSLHFPGKVKWFRTSIQPVRNESGKPVVVMLHSTDITESKLAEERIRQSEHKYRTLFNDSPDGYLIIRDGVFLECNKAVEKIIGGTRDDIIGKSPDMLSPEFQPDGMKSVDKVPQILNDTLKNGNSSFEWLHKKVDGTLFHSLINLAAIEYEGSEALLTTWKDITNIKEAEDALKKSEEALNNAQKLANMGSWEFDRKSNLILCSENQHVVFGLKTENRLISEEVFFRHIHPEDRELLHTTLDRISENGKPANIDLRFIGKDSSVKWAENHIIPLYNDGQLKGFRGVTIDITEKKLANQRIREQNDRLNGIIRALPDFFFIVDKNGNYLEYYGPDIKELHIPNKDQIGLNVREIFDPETARLHLRKINECHTEKKVLIYDYSLVTEGQEKYYEIRLVPIENDKIIRFVHEFTDKKVREDVIMKLSLAVEQSPVAIIITNLSGEIEYANTAFQTISGYLIEELIGQNTRILNSGSMSPEFYRDMWEFILKGKVWTGELINKKKNGKLYWEEMTINPIQDEYGAIKNFLAIKQDISTRKKAEQEINALNANLELRVRERTEELAVMNETLMEEIEERNAIEEALKAKTAELENFFTVALDLLCIADTAGNFIKLNKSWETILGYTVRQLEKKNIMEFVHPEDRLTTAEALRQLDNRHPIIYFTNRIHTRDDAYRYIEWHIVPVDKLIYAAARDITNRILFEQELNDAKREAEEANKAKSEFLANMSHEIRTPMNAVLGYSELLGSTEMNELQLQYVSSIKSSGKSLLTLINDILDLSKIEAGKMDLEYDYISTSAFFNEFAAIFAFHINERGLKFEVEIASGTPQGIYIDEARLRQVVFNLIGNAIKFTPKGYIKLKVYSENPRVISYSEKASEDIVDLVIEVEDTGIGISGEAQESIFEAFIQEREYKRFGGTGLGLAISKKLVSLMNGEIKLQSEQGKGSIFSVRIPDVAYQHEYSRSDTENDIDPSRILFEKATLLIVDDVVDNRNYLREVFRESAIDVVEAANGHSAYDLAKKIVPDVIITDIRMPDMDGFVLLDKLKKNKILKEIPVIAYSASVLRAQKEKIYKSKFSGLLVKPVRISDLYRQLMPYIPYRELDQPASLQKESVELVVGAIRDIEGLISALENDFYTRWQTFSVRQPLKEIRKFGEDLVELGEKHTCRHLIKYGQDLIAAAASFNIERILKLLAKYTDFIRKLKDLR